MGNKRWRKAYPPIGLRNQTVTTKCPWQQRINGSRAEVTSGITNINGHGRSQFGHHLAANATRRPTIEGSHGNGREKQKSDGLFRRGWCGVYSSVSA